MITGLKHAALEMAGFEGLPPHAMLALDAAVVCFA